MPDRWVVIELLKSLTRRYGRGLLAKQLSLDRNVAVKTIQIDWSANPRAVARFIREAYAAGRTVNAFTNVVQIYDLGQDGGINFLDGASGRWFTG